jgi:hypothetical protein
MLQDGVEEEAGLVRLLDDQPVELVLVAECQLLSLLASFSRSWQLSTFCVFCLFFVPL